MKPLGDAWAWSRKASTGDIAAVIAMTLALAVGSEITVGPTPCRFSRRPSSPARFDFASSAGLRLVA